MQKTEEIDFFKLTDIVHSIFQEPAIAYEDYSDFDTALLKFDDEQSLMKVIVDANKNEKLSANFAIYYPEAKGYVFEEKTSVNPDKCHGATYRHVSKGWGLIHLQIDFRKKPKINVRITVNTRKRAEAWFATYPEMRDPSLWDWKFVERQARRAIKVLRKSV